MLVKWRFLNNPNLTTLISRRLCFVHGFDLQSSTNFFLERFPGSVDKLVLSKAVFYRLYCFWYALTKSLRTELARSDNFSSRFRCLSCATLSALVARISLGVPPSNYRNFTTGDMPCNWNNAAPRIPTARNSALLSSFHPLIVAQSSKCASHESHSSFPTTENDSGITIGLLAVTYEVEAPEPVEPTSVDITLRETIQRFCRVH